jgi:hypothetical protein
LHQFVQMSKNWIWQRMIFLIFKRLEITEKYVGSIMLLIITLLYSSIPKISLGNRINWPALS